MTLDGRSRASAEAEKYRNLIYEFMNGDISAADFQTRYMRMFKQDDDIELGEEFDILEYLFTSADGYVEDPEARSYLREKYPAFRAAGQGLNEDELRAEAREAYRQLFEK
jgi:hypothetical protein